MKISDLTDPQAVLDAVSEYDAIGSEAFQAKYGFGRAVSYFLQIDGRLYDSKAIVGAAVGFQHGEPLPNTEFSGGEPVVRTLTRLGFRVTRPGDWHYRIGDVTRRAEIARVYGGSEQGGIEPSAKSPNIFAFTDPSAGAQHGYNFDEWDEEDPTVFHYSGEGQIDNQRTTSRGNAALLNHGRDGRVIRLFESEDRRRPGGKLQTYLGAFRVDPENPYRVESAPDREGEMRDVLVFRFLTDDRAPNAGDPRAERPPESVDDKVRIETIDPERNNVREFEVSPAVGKIARRREAELVLEFEDYLRGLGRTVKRRRFTLPRGQGVLVTDTYDETENTLYEAKSDIKRSTIRLALGQILDYRRLFDSPPRVRILLPDLPNDDLRGLLHDYGVGITYPKGGDWETSEPS